MIRHTLFASSFLTAGLLAGCASAPASNPNSAVMHISVNTAGIRCSHRNPEIEVSGTPAGTVNYYFNLKDLDIPGWRHGGGTVPAATNGVIQAGSIQGGYNGPCPPDGTHTYVFTVQALDAAGTVIGEGSQAIEM